MKKIEELTKQELYHRVVELENQLKIYKYGLIWEKKFKKEESILSLLENIPVLNRIESIKNNSINDNILIQGDNFHSLTALNMLNDSKGIFDIIYIDPPYNTGKEDFIYNDNYVNKEDSYRHSKWLSFINNRLLIAKQLLKSDGAILISIDDNEFAQLKLLCDSIFGENNFVDCLVWDKKSSAKGVPPKNMIVNVHEYILVYQKSDTFSFLGEERSLNGFSNPDNDPRGPWRNTNIKSTIKTKDKSFTIVNPENGNEYNDTWAYSKEELDRLISEKVLIFPKNSNGQVRRKEYYNEFKNNNIPIKSSLGLFDNQKNTEMLKNIIPEVLFLNPKPINLIKYLLRVTSRKDAFILDFFAGSGTTGQAVLELNQEDGGNRRFILCTNNENNICTDVTYPRLKTVITGIRSDGSKYSDGIPANFHYFKTDFISHSGNADQSKYDLVEKVNHLLCISENVFNLVEQTNKYFIYGDTDGLKEVFMFIDYYDKVSFDMFKNKIESSKATEKIVYVFSTDNMVDERVFEGIKGIELKPIPSKMYEIYKEIVQDIKRR
jgi:adenine-specific DNA-methyltransferase